MKNVDDTTMIKLAFESLDLVIPDRSDTLTVGGRDGSPHMIQINAIARLPPRMARGT